MKTFSSNGVVSIQFALKAFRSYCSCKNIHTAFKIIEDITVLSVMKLILSQLLLL